MSSMDNFFSYFGRDYQNYYTCLNCSEPCPKLFPTAQWPYMVCESCDKKSSKLVSIDTIVEPRISPRTIVLVDKINHPAQIGIITDLEVPEGYRGMNCKHCGHFPCQCEPQYICEYCKIHVKDPMTNTNSCLVQPQGYHRFVYRSLETLEDKSKLRIPEFINFLEQSKVIHLKKNADYASEENPYSNFERSGIIASWFDDSVDKSFAILVGIKLARIAELRKGKEPKNESLFDSFLDLGTYCFLWGAYIVRRGRK